MTLLDLSATPSRPAPAAVVRTLYPLVSAEAGAEAAASATGAAVDRADLEQSVWLRLLERLPEQGPPKDAARWVRDTVRGEARRARRTVRNERPYRDETAPDPAGCPERAFVGADQRRLLRAAVDRLPARCARVLTALLAPNDPTYREIAGELAMSQGSLGPIRSRCLGCLRRMLAAEVVAPEPRGKER
ncbi:MULTISPECIES: sigma-70 family RNA polymerase sigma factor [unclassified Streptomyces]|uniref:sigma-70 family RNA polymerase sigma factor n=1 Tax=unclassified Streptomyces TaxID=2593676 RepID=UPI002E2A464A|nr:sigma-70 family RNA polymerase sigma factor [Streptomyces sp. NBC_00342]